MSDDDHRQGCWRFLPVFVIALLCSVIIFTGESLTREAISRNRQSATIKMLREVMPLAHDNDMLDDRMRLQDRESTVYRARREGDNVGLVILPVSAKGYNGRITLAVGLDYGGTLTGVRVIEHRETRGLGNAIHQEVSPWIHGFEGQSLNNTVNGGWSVKRDGGSIDNLSGATISARGVINAVRNTLEYYRQHRDELYRRPR